MPAPGNALQTGIYSRLTGYSTLTSLLQGDTYNNFKIFDHVPQNTNPPYVVIGEDLSIDSDTKTDNGWESTITIHCWDFLKSGRKTVKEIMSAIYDALHKQEANITVSGFALILIYCEYMDSFQETAVEGGQDHYYHGVMRFRVIVTES